MIKSYSLDELINDKDELLDDNTEDLRRFKEDQEFHQYKTLISNFLQKNPDQYFYRTDILKAVSLYRGRHKTKMDSVFSEGLDEGLWIRKPGKQMGTWKYKGVVQD